MFLALWYMLPEFFRIFLIFSITGVNVWYTIGLIIMCLYWMMVIVGAFDIDTLDFDFDGESNLNVGFSKSLLEWFNIGEVPIMILISLSMLSMWFMSMCGSFFLGQTLGGILNIAAFFAYLVISFMVTKIISTPLKSLFKSMKNQDEKVKIVGNFGTALSDLIPGKKGQIEISKTGQSIKVMALLDESSSDVHKQDQVIVVKQEGDLYRVTKFEN